MKRSGFTMIELVFVIVILGILASVAIPKLAATRDDANIAKASTEVSAIVSDLGSYYTAHGGFEKNVSVMTNVALYKDLTANETPAGTVDFKAGNTIHYGDKTRKQNCLDIVANDTNGTVTLSVNNAGVAGSLFCKGLQTAVAPLIKEHTFGGSSIY
jgi:prepilin-type N-terminal cleavage/methylation domain-containing protein